MAEIIFTTGPFAGQKLEIPETGIILGKDESADLVITDPSVSGQHAQLRIEDGAWYIIDLNSTNGTVVNGNAIQAVPLKSGDIVEIGDTKFTFSADGSPEIEAAE